MRSYRERLRRSLALLALGCLFLGACSDDKPRDTGKPTSEPPPATGKCGDFTIAYDPRNGYEASAFIVGELAAEHLDCTVTYVKTTTRKSWQLIASGGADVYLDAYGSAPQRARFAGGDGPVTVVGRNGVRGVVHLMAPYFMAQRGLATSRDLPDTERIGWGVTTPAVTTAPELLPLARAIVEFQQLDYVVRDADSVGVGSGMSSLLTQAALDQERQLPNLYLVEGPAPLLADNARQISVQVPGSASDPCVPSRVSTLCALGNFNYVKIANSEFAASGSPAYSLVYKYQLDRAAVTNICELVLFSGYQVGPADVASWINTHAQVWRRWLP